jgi:hypothetical protein
LNKRLLIAVGLAVACVVLWVFRGEERAALGSSAAPADPAAAASRARGSDRSGSGDPSTTSAAVAKGASPEALADSGTPVATKPLFPPATAADGFVEVRVVAQGKPFGAAKVRLYWRGGRDRQTRQIDWRLAGAGQTSKDGVLRLPARPGSYLATARGPAFAPAHLEFQRPSGEPVTKISLELTAGLGLSGRTVQKGGSEAVPLAQVTLTYSDATSGAGGGRMRMRGGARSAADVPVEEELLATSDEKGNFHFDGLEAGSYEATATAAGYSRGTARAAVPSMRELVVELAQSSFIEGYVVAPDGRPAAGAEVIATGGAEPATGVASETGAFSLEVAPRAWQLAAKRGDEAGRADAPVVVAAGSTARGVKIQLGAAASIAGSVLVAASQAPLPGAQIFVSPHGASAASGSASSDATGSFVVAGLAPGSYDVVVTASGFSDGTYLGVTVDRGQKFPLRVLLHQTGQIQGLVTDSAGRGVANALVQNLQGGFGLFGGGGGSGPQPQLQARADDSGAYTLSGLPAGHSQFTALRDGSSLGATASADVPEGGSARLDFQLHDEGTVTGHVRRRDGTPAPTGATVRATPADNRFMRGDWAAIPVDATGAYVASLPAGPYSLMANAVGADPGVPGSRNFVNVEAGKASVMDLVYSDGSDPPTGFSGTVLEPGGAPSPGAMVRASGAGGGRFGSGSGFILQADESGHFDSGQQRSDLPDSFQVVSANGGRTGAATVVAGQNDVTVQLQPGGTLNGHLTSGPVDQFTVNLSIQRGSPFVGLMVGNPNATLQFSGDHFQLRDVPGTGVHVVVTTADGRSAQADATLAPPGAQDVEIPLQPLAQVTGRMVDSVTQQPVPDVMLFIQGSIGAQGGSTTSASDGSFALQVAAGTFTLRAMAPNYRPLQQQFTATAGQPVQLGNVQIARQTAASGTIGAWVRGTPAMVVSVIPQGPADLGGLRIGDQLLSVDGQAVVTAVDANAHLNGPPGSPCSISLTRNSSPMTLSITRAP